MNVSTKFPRLRLSGFLFLMIVGVIGMAAAEPEVNYVPQIHGAFRARWEGNLHGDGSRFQVRNARVTLSGDVAPVIDYFIQADMCDRGKMKILDAWGRLELARGLKLQAGQFRLPFGTDCFRAPSNYVFANRSFVGKQMCNVRGVGAKLGYAIAMGEARRSLMIEGGAFNPTSMADHEVWVKELSYAAKAVLSVDDVKVAAGVQTIEPDSVRMNLWGASATWSACGWTVEGEYMHKHYAHRSAKPAHSWVVWADYGFPVKAGVFNRGSVQARWDGLTAHSDGTRGADGLLRVNHPSRQRVTVGATLTYAHKWLRCDLRLDYEKYFYRSSVLPITPADADKLTAEMVIKF